MRLLFLSQVLPYPLDAGPKTRAYFVLRWLAARHEVTLLSFVRADDSPEALAHLRALCAAVHVVPMPRARWRDGWHLLRSAASAQPFLIARDWRPAMAERLDALLAAPGFDAVHADQLWMAPYALRAAAQPRPPKLLLDQHNAVFQIPLRLAQGQKNPLLRAALRWESRKLARYERAVCQRFDHIVWVTRDDAEALFPDGAAGTPTVIPIAVEVAGQPPLERAAGAQRLIFLGGLHWPPNAEGIGWFAEQLWPRVRAACPDARLTIVGRRPPPALAALAAQDAQVEVTGYVEDPRPLLRACAAFLVPLHAGGGMRVKILDAWRWGLPVVSTRIGAEGLAAVDGENLLLADGADDFVAATVRLLREPALAERIAAGGRRTAEQCYDWQRCYEGWAVPYAALGAE